MHFYLSEGIPAQLEASPARDENEEAGNFIKILNDLAFNVDRKGRPLVEPNNRKLFAFGNSTELGSIISFLLRIIA